MKTKRNEEEAMHMKKNAESKKRKRTEKKPKSQEPKSQIESNNNKKKLNPSVVVKVDDSHEQTISKRVNKPFTFLDKMKARLSGGHFRMLNEKLYTCTGSEALEYFKEDPSLFDMYHAGYQEQMSHWPELPVNIIIKWLKDRSPSLLVADFGCGDGRLAKNVKNKVFSFDLVSRDPSVTACDMSNTPLETSSVDVAVFCLSLMGTNVPSYLQEAHRVLKPSGWLLIAEVQSRLDPTTGGANPKEFSKAICDLGFTSELIDFSNKMFILLYFKKKEKANSKVKGIEWPQLKPCLYKRR
jgi:ribosomal RNA-processing protein 8